MQLLEYVQVLNEKNKDSRNWGNRSVKTWSTQGRLPKGSSTYCKLWRLGVNFKGSFHWIIYIVWLDYMKNVPGNLSNWLFSGDSFWTYSERPLHYFLGSNYVKAIRWALGKMVKWVGQVRALYWHFRWDNSSLELFYILQYPWHPGSHPLDAHNNT